ncbi:MAG: hypothetical protein Q7U57_00960 [Methylovulum sp.]|nr:hypothetical protein [Methylovulum sp.]
MATDDLALLELLPIPHKNLASWDHDNLYPTKSGYREVIVPRRIAWLKKQIDDLKPKAVVMYGTTPPYPEYWQSIVGDFLQTNEGWAYRKTSRTTFVICQHPLARGLTDAYFYNIGRFLKESVIPD